jgi:hypothetical protein
MTLDALLAIASSSQGRSPSTVAIWSDRRAPVEVEFGHGERALFDAYSGASLGAGAVRTRRFFETVTQLHRYFGVSAEAKPIHAPSRERSISRCS